MNNFDTIYVRQGATYEVTFTDTDNSADTLTLTVSNDSGVVGSDTQNYTIVDGKPTATVSIQANFPVGTYAYMYTIAYTDGTVVKLPDTAGCEGGCDLPEFVVCVANDIEES